MMQNIDALRIISKYRGEGVIVATMTANYEWGQVTDNPGLDLMFSGAMGKASSVGLGLALAMPERKVIVLDGDGSLLMNLGSLVTIANMAPANLIHFVFENTIYRTTGGQPVPMAGKMSLTKMAEGAGYPKVYGYTDLSAFEKNAEQIMTAPGLAFVCLETEPAPQHPPYPFTNTADILERFKQTLGS